MELGLQYQRVRPITSAHVFHLAFGCEEPASVVRRADQRRKARGGIETRHAQPVDGPFAAHEPGGARIADQCIVLDGDGHWRWWEVS